MKNKTAVALILIVVGVAISLVSVYAYPLGVARHESFGAFQIFGTLLGIIILIIGLIRLLKKN